MKKFNQTIISVALLCFAGVLQAQTPKKDKYTNFSDTTFAIKNVDVVGTRAKAPEALSRMRVSLAKLPLSISFLDAKQFTSRGIYDMNEATRFFSGINIRTTYGGFDQLSIRGFDYSPVSVDGMRDERSTINSYPLSDLSDVERIEVLRGPASVLQGHSAVGGALNITRLTPDGKARLDARLALASWNYRRATFIMGGNLAGNTNYVASLNWSNSDGWRNTGNKRFKTYLALGGKISEKGEWQLRGSYNRDYYGTEIGLPPTMRTTVYHTDGSVYLQPWQVQPRIARNNRYNSVSDFMYHTSWNVSGKYIHNFAPDMRLTEHVSYSKDDINYFSTEELGYRTSDKPVYPYYIIKDNKKQYMDMDSVVYTFPLRFSHMAYTLQNQISLDGSFHTGNIKHNYAGGYTFAYMRRTSYTGYKIGTDVVGTALTAPVSIENPRPMGYMDTRFSQAIPTRTFSHGLFAQNLIEFSKQWQVLAALRYDFYHYETARTEALDGKRKFKDPGKDKYEYTKAGALTYRLGAVYAPVQEVQFYTSIANSYLPYRQFYNLRNIYINSDGHEFIPEKNKSYFKPRTGWQFEVGVRADINKWLNGQFSAYYIKQKNILRTLGQREEIIDGKNVKRDIIGQVGTIDSKGFEVELTATPLPNLYLTTGYSFTMARYGEIQSNPLLPLDTNTGDFLTHIPKHKWYSLGNYTFEQGALKGLGLRYNVTFMDKMYRNYAENIIYDPYTLVGLGVSYQLRNKVTLSVDVRNLFNTKYYAQSLGDQLVPSAPTSLLFSINYQL